MNDTLACRDELRRQKVRDDEVYGLDYLEVSDDHLTLTVVFLGKAPQTITPSNVRIDGGRRVTGITVTGVQLRREADPDLDDSMRVTIDRPGDFSPYVLRLVQADPHGRPGTVPLEGFDPRYAQLTFSFGATCPSDLDCAAPAVCPSEVMAEPDISYLAKDYASFRQLILDRLALIMPGWQERHVPDIGITLVEVLAYIGDYLSYYQDAVATEAYLDTARRRISVRRHVRLVDYPMHDGCNARAWICLETSEPVTLPAGEFSFITDAANGPPLPDTALLHDEVPAGSYQVFEPLVNLDVVLSPAHNQIEFWTWGDQECCLPRGSTRATLKDGWLEPPLLEAKDASPQGEPEQRGDYPVPRGAESGHPVHRRRALSLVAGDILILEEIRGPVTGEMGDADPSHRQAVRLTRVEHRVDELYDQPIVEIAWGPEDALGFPLCLSAVGAAPTCRLLDPVSVARGNVILADHGQTLTRCGAPAEQLRVPVGTAQPAGCAGVGVPRDPTVTAPAFYPSLSHGPVTQTTPFPAPQLVARLQAGQIGQILPAVRHHLHQLWHRAQHDHVLSSADLQELRTIVGEQTMAGVGLPLPGARPSPHPTPHGEARSLRRLLIHLDRLLAQKIRRLESLAQRARSGYVLGSAEEDEIRETWGERYAQGLDQTNPAYWGPARDALTQDPRAALPVIRLLGQPDGQDDCPPVPMGDGNGDVWLPRRDLLDSNGQDHHFVAELDDEGVTHLRFGDGTLGQAVTPSSTFCASYRIGNGMAGNVALESISHLVSCSQRFGAITRVRNPLAASGGIDPEPILEVKLFAPAAGQGVLQRAITADDYAALAGQVPGVQRAAASLRWTGGWYEMQVAVDPLGTEQASHRLLEAVRDYLYPYRRIGHDLLVEPAQYVPLDIALRVCVLPDYVQAHVRAALLDVFGSGLLPDGSRGFFHPDNLTFGDDIHLSKLVAVAMAIPGVQSADVTRLQRLFQGDRGELAAGVLTLGPLEVPQLDNDPSFPERGKLTLELRGGR